MKQPLHEMVLAMNVTISLEMFFIFPPLTGVADFCVGPLVESTPPIREKKTPLIRVNNFFECFTDKLKIKS